jgi:hypothetical protein
MVGRAQDRVAGLRAAAEVSAADVVSSGATTLVSDTTDGAGIEIEAGLQAYAVYAFIAPGERIIGVQYRKVIFSLFSNVDVEKAKLDGNEWVMFLGDRDFRDGLGDTADVLGADLEESLILEDLEHMGFERTGTISF